MVGTAGVALMLSVLVEVALLKLVIVPEELKLTIPAALLVIPAMVPVPLRLIVPKLVRFARTVLMAPAPVMVAVPVFVNVVMELVPPRLSVPALVSPPVPESAVATVKVPLLVSVTPVITTVGNVTGPVNVCALVLKVCDPVLPVIVGVVVIPPRKTGVTAAFSVHDAPVLTVTKPTKVLNGPVALEKTIDPLVPPPTVVVPFTVNAKPADVNVVPSPIERLPPMVMVATVVVDAVPLKDKLPVTEVAALKVFAPLPERVRLANALVLVMVCAPPPKLTVPVPAVNVPVLDQFPFTVKVTAPVSVRVALVAIVILLQTAEAVMLGYLGAPVGIETLVIASGTEPHDQFDAVLQLVSVAPVHKPGVQPPELTFKTPLFKK